MKDNRDRQMPQFAGWTWELNGYAAKVPFYNADDLTMREVQNVFQLDPEPPQMELTTTYAKLSGKEIYPTFPFSCTTLKSG